MDDLEGLIAIVERYPQDVRNPAVVGEIEIGSSPVHYEQPD
jgi:hypothetical protein